MTCQNKYISILDYHLNHRMQARIGRLREKTGSEFNLQKVIKASSVFYLRDVALFYPELFLYIQNVYTLVTILSNNEAVK